MHPEASPARKSPSTSPGQPVGAVRVIPPIGTAALRVGGLAPGARPPFAGVARGALF